MENNDNNLLHYDFQGWPVYKLTLKQILLQLGAKEENNQLYFNIDNPILNAFPETIEDDGMGYGVNETFISLADISKYTDDSIHVRLWKDVEWKNPQE